MGKHRKSEARHSRVLKQGLPGLTAAAVSATGLATTVMTGTTATMAQAPAVQLTAAAVITPANSTAQIFAGSDYYNGDWQVDGVTYGNPQVVPFFLGPQGIADAIDANSGNTDGVVVLASGWGAGQTGTALGLLQNDTSNVKLVILDNNSNRAAGGFWTTYAPFAPLLGTSAEPTPNDTGVPIVDVAYEYNINSDAPTDPLNLAADANSLMAYVYGYGGQSTAKIPAEALEPVAEGDQHYHYIVDSNGEIIGERIPVDGNITYVTVKQDNLPLLRPLRSLPGGDDLADALEPTVKKVVDAGYQDGNSIPEDPGVAQPMTPGSSIGQLLGSTEQPSTLQNNNDRPTSGLRKNPLDTSTNPLSVLPTGKKLLDMTGGAKFSPGSAKPGTSAPGDAKPLQQVAKKVGEALGGLKESVEKAVNGPNDAGNDSAE